MTGFPLFLKMDKFCKCMGFASCCSTVKKRDLEVVEKWVDCVHEDDLPLGVFEVFDSLLAQLSSLENSSWADQMIEKIQSCACSLRFLKMFFWSLSSLEDTDAEIRHTLICLSNSREVMRGISIYKLLVFPPLANRELVIKTWIMDLESRILNCKREFEESCELVMEYSLRCDYLKNKMSPDFFDQKKMTLDFLDAILENLKDLYKFKTDDEILLINNRMGIIEKNVTLLRTLFNFMPVQWWVCKEMRVFEVAVLVFAQYSANLVFLYWVKAVDEDMAAHMNLLLVNMLQKYKSCVSVFKAVYIRFLEEIKSIEFDSLVLGQIIQIILDVVLENLVDILKDDYLIFRESLTFVISFLAITHNQHVEEEEEWTRITVEIEVLVKEDLYVILSFDDMNGNLSKENTHLSDFLWKVEQVKGKIQQAYNQIRDSFSYDFPKTNGLGYFDFLLQKLGYLKEKLKRDTKYISFAKHLIIKVVEELMSLRPFLDDLFEQQQEQTELKDTWLKVINLAYQTEYAIDSCLVIGDPLWYNMARLMQVSDEIKVCKSNLEKIEGRKVHNGRDLCCSTTVENSFPEVPWISSFNEVTVGLRKEVDIIVENLVGGSEFFDIVAIVGMAGLGKTTLANKVYNSSEVRNHFHVFAYCIASQAHNTRRMLIDILDDIKGKDDKMYDMIEEDLQDMLRKCLKGRRYLIIMDDMWEVKAWDGIKRSLPNDGNGSRVVITTRIHNVALQAKKDSILHRLRFLTEEESWELLQRKAFRADGCPPNLLEVGKMIARNCKGLPLTIVLIAGLLARTNRSLSLWSTISKAIRSHVSTEGCMDVLELSYKHLPEHLKPCFLYYGTFTKDELISVNKLTLLWIGEGFVPNANNENLKNVAKGYLCDLVDRSLVIANKRSSYGGIKSCRIHDLVHEFCLGKAQEENFFQILDIYEASNSSNSIVRNAYRVCTDMNMKPLNDATNICSSIRSLLYRRKWGGPDHHDRLDVSNLKLVQVIDMEGSKWDTTSLTSSIGEIATLVNLRYIATSFPIERPTRVLSSISNLWNLEILILTGSRRFMLELPRTIWDMIRLRHVDVKECYLLNSGVKKCETAYPQMVNLESLSSPNISSIEALEDLLRRSPSLRKLSFHYKYPKDVSQKRFRFPKLDSQCKLESLKVSCVGSELRLRPFSLPSTLRKLSLSGGFLPWMDLQPISELPCLEVLKLLRGAFIGLKWDMEDIVFPMLKFLRLEFLDLHEWIAYGESFPSLEVLIVDECYHLDTIPPCFGEMPTLQRIEVFASPDATTSVLEIQEAQYNYGNEDLEVILPKSRKFNVNRVLQMS